MSTRGLIVLAIVASSGCAYNVQPASMKVVNIHSSYDSKVPGRFAVVLDDSVRNVNREVKPSSHVCGAHRYPVSLGDAIAVSVKSTLASVLEQTTEQAAAPTAEQMSRAGLRGVVVVKMDEFSPKLNCSMGMFAGSCSASTDVSFGVNVRGPTGSLFATSAGGSKSFDGDAGGVCEGGANVLSESIARATRDALERLAERISSSPALRQVAAARTAPEGQSLAIANVTAAVSPRRLRGKELVSVAVGYAVLGAAEANATVRETLSLSFEGEALDQPHSTEVVRSAGSHKFDYSRQIPTGAPPGTYRFRAEVCIGKVCSSASDTFVITQ